MKGDVIARSSKSRPVPWVGGKRRYLLPTLTIVLIAAIIGLVAASPLALDVFGDNPAWTRRSEIGQTYGAAAALLSVLALVGIAASLLVQINEAKIAREQTSRAMHYELLRMALDDPLYRECWGQTRSVEDEAEIRQHIYTNLIVSYWQSRYELRTFNEAHVRAGAADLFSGTPGRRFWSRTRETRFKTSQTRRARHFHRILDNEYHRAVATGPATPSPGGTSRPAGPRPQSLAVGAVGLILVGAAAHNVLGWVWRTISGRGNRRRG
jgi:hypothetical protein